MVIVMAPAQALEGPQGPSLFAKLVNIKSGMSEKWGVPKKKGGFVSWKILEMDDWLVVWLPFFIFPYIGNNHPNWLIFFRGVQTTNQMIKIGVSLFQEKKKAAMGWQMSWHWTSPNYGDRIYDNLPQLLGSDVQNPQNRTFPTPYSYTNNGVWYLKLY